MRRLPVSRRRARNQLLLAALWSVSVAAACSSESAVDAGSLNEPGTGSTTRRSESPDTAWVACREFARSLSGDQELVFAQSVDPSVVSVARADGTSPGELSRCSFISGTPGSSPTTICRNGESVFVESAESYLVDAEGRTYPDPLSAAPGAACADGQPP